MDEALSRIREREEYKGLVRAYKTNNQTELRELVETVFGVISVMDPINLRRTILYHGVKLKEGVSLDDYAGIVSRIMKEGILSSIKDVIMMIIV